MISAALKGAWLTLLAGPMRLSAMAYRRLRAPRSGVVRVQLGPGRRNYLEGWINVDANFVTARLDVWADLRGALPFPDGTVDVIYSHHVIEHLPDGQLPSHFREMHRCLKPGGLVRIAGPNADGAIKKLLEGDASWFPDFPERREGGGGRFNNFLLCANEHRSLLTWAYLSELATAAGFAELRSCRSGVETARPDLVDLALLATEEREDLEVQHTIVLEAVKPASGAALPAAAASTMMRP